MGVAIKDLIVRKEVNLDNLRNKILVVDAYNQLYQFLSSIRQIDGSLLTDSKGEVTSHLVGLFSRTTKLMKKGIKLAYVFDGEAPTLKKKERERRKEVKINAEKKYHEAKSKKDLKNMKMTSRLTPEMVDEAKKLVEYLGLPVIQAPGEGEAQAAYMVKKGDAFAIVSQDYDSFIYGATKVIQNLTISAKRKNGASYTSLKPSILTLSENLNKLGIDQEQLIVLCILVGTDYNIGGIKGIGPKTALKLVKEYKKDDDIFKENKWKENFDFPWTDVFYTIKNMTVTDNYSLNWAEADKEKLISLLVDTHEFSLGRVERNIMELTKGKEKRQQKGLGEFF